MKSNITEQYVIDHCLHCPKDVIENELFPLFQDQLDVKVGVKHVGYHTPVYSISRTSFEQWCIDNYSKLREAAYGTWREQMEMVADGTFDSHVSQVKLMYPKE